MQRAERMPDYQRVQRKKSGKKMVGMGRFELPTPRTPSECSTRLSHIPTVYGAGAPRGDCNFTLRGGEAEWKTGQEARAGLSDDVTCEIYG